jgi:hypothetical protein
MLRTTSIRWFAQRETTMPGPVRWYRVGQLPQRTAPHPPTFAETASRGVRAAPPQRRYTHGPSIPAERVDELLAAFEALPERQGRPWDGEEAFRWVLAQPRR